MNTENYPSHEAVAGNIGKNIPKKKNNFCGMKGGLAGPNNVLHIVDLTGMPKKNLQVMMDNILHMSEVVSGSSDGIEFLTMDILLRQEK